MRLALFADLHSNLEALEACLLHARDHGAGRLAFLGDLVGYGADPVAVVDRVMGLASQGALVLKGNHDAAVAEGLQGARPEVQQSVDWTRAVLRGDQREFLAQLPLQLQHERVTLVHASAWQPERWEYVTDAVSAQRCFQAMSTPWCFAGHVHEQTLWYQGAGRQCMPFVPTPGMGIPLGAHRQWMATVGSAGQPRDGNPAAAYALFDLGTRRLSFHRVVYDRLEAARKIAAVGLPESFSRRLLSGH